VWLRSLSRLSRSHNQQSHPLPNTTSSCKPTTRDPWPGIKSQLQGRPASEAILRVLSFFNLSRVNPELYPTNLHRLQEREFPNAQPLPGVEALLQTLSTSENGGRKIHIALATRSHEGHFKLKTQHLEGIFGVFAKERRILDDDKWIPKGRGKPSPDIYLVGLKAINDTLDDGEEDIKPEECLVFEDGVPGVIAGRRAGMRVVWVPHQESANQYAGREAEVLAGRGEGEENVDEHQLGQVGDGWGEQLVSLVDFPYEEYGIVAGK
jgi:pseudouridine-5'-monophosphatase